MDLSRRNMLIAGAALPVAGLWAMARGQDRPVAPTGAIPAGADEDPLLAAELLIAGRTQIANSQLAARQTQSGDVRAFAEAEIAEHRTMQSRLSDRGFLFPTVTPITAGLPGGAPVDAIAGVPGNPPPAPTANRPVVPQPGTRPAENASPPPVVAAPPVPAPQAATRLVSVGRLALSVGESRLILIDTQVGDQCIATFQRDVGSLTGLAFDRAYIGNQLFEHYGLLDRVTVFRRHASPVLLSVLVEALPIIERHIATLKGIMARLETTR